MQKILRNGLSVHYQMLEILCQKLLFEIATDFTLSKPTFICKKLLIPINQVL